MGLVAYPRIGFGLLALLACCSRGLHAGPLAGPRREPAERQATSLAPAVGPILPVTGAETLASPQATLVAHSELERRLAETERRLAELSATLEPVPSKLEPSPTAKPSAALAAPAAGDIAYPTLNINGVFQADAGWFQQDATSRASVGDLQDGADFRRARLSAKGAAWDNVNYMFQMDFAAFGRPTFTDVWVETVRLPAVGSVRVGHFKQPFGLETLTSFRFLTFMERSLLFQSFQPFRHTGILLYNHTENQRLTWAASLYRVADDPFGGSLSDQGSWALASRVTALPYYDEPSQGRYYLHLGAGLATGQPTADTLRYSTIPELFIGATAPGAVGSSGVSSVGVNNGTPLFVDTGPFAASWFTTFGLEALWVRGPLSVQGEAMLAMANRSTGGDAVFPGAYAQVGYFLTGEHRPYDKLLGAPDRVMPFENFFALKRGAGGGRGAWEVAARCSFLQLNDADIHGGRLNDLTLALNWHLNPQAKVVVNWVHAFLDHPTRGRSDTDLIAVRAQVDF